MIVFTIKLKDITLEVTIREDTNLVHLVEMISLFADFKQFPKKFKEIFANYIKNEKNSVLT